MASPDSAAKSAAASATSAAASAQAAATALEETVNVFGLPSEAAAQVYNIQNNEDVKAALSTSVDARVDTVAPDVVAGLVPDAVAAEIPAATDARIDANITDPASLQRATIAAITENVTTPQQFGAPRVPTNATDATAAIQAMFDAVKAGTAGRNIYFPAGTYKVSAEVSIASTHGVTIWGASGGPVASGKSLIYFTGTGSGTAFNMQKCSGMTLRNMTFLHTSASFTGTLVDPSGNASGNTAHLTIDRCFFGSNDYTTIKTATLLLLDGVYDVNITDSVFYGSATAIKGIRAPSAPTYNNFSNGVVLQSCMFAHYADQAILNTGESWSLETCTFEPRADGVPAAVVIEAGVATLDSRGLTVKGCWFADDGSGVSGDWIKWRGRGLALIGNVVSMQNASTNFVKVMQACHGVTAFGNSFRGVGSAFDFTGAGAIDSVSTVVLGNDQNGGATPLFRSATYPAGIIQGSAYGEVYLTAHDTANPVVVKGRVTFEKTVTMNEPWQVVRAASSTAWNVFATGDTQPRVSADTDGILRFGPGGTTATDTILRRSGVGLLRTGGKLVADAGIAVGNSAAATTTGTLSKKMEVFDNAGNSIGFVPIYTTIT